MHYISPMKTALFALSLLFAAGCGSKSDDAQPVTKPAPAPAATYTTAAGPAVTVNSTAVFSVTAAPNQPGQLRRAILVRAMLSTGFVLNVTYEYLGGAFPASEGPVPLDAIIRVNYEANQQLVSFFLAPVTAGTLRVDSINPQIVSGTYSGPLTAGGPVVSFTFNRLAI